MPVRATGYERRGEEVFFQEIVKEARSTIPDGSALDDSPDSVFGQLARIHATKAADLEEAIEDTYNSFGETANGHALRVVCAYNGVAALGPQKSSVTANVTCLPNTYAAGSITATVDGDDTARFRNRAFTKTALGASPFPVIFDAVEFGPVRAPALTLVNLVGPPAGVTAISNPGDANVGSFEESDSRLRLRRRQEVGKPSRGPLGSLRAAASGILGINDTRAYTNRSDHTDAAGLPPHSFELVVAGSFDEDALAEAMWPRMPLGIKSYGNTLTSTIDEEGNLQEFYYSLAVTRRIYCRIVGRRGIGYPGNENVQKAIADFSDGLLTLYSPETGAVISGRASIGSTLYRTAYATAALTVTGVIGVTSVLFSVDNVNWLNVDFTLTQRETAGYLSNYGIQTVDVRVDMTS